MNRITSLTLTALLLAPLANTLHAAPEKGSRAETTKQQWTFTPDPKLPNVLILGDSISIGYTLEVRALLEGKANVFRPLSADGKKAENCAGTTMGGQEIDRWFGGRKWAVIHFNWGMHDLKHVTTPGTGQNSNKPNDPVQATVEQYAQNLTAIVKKLKATNARLVFATTTPVAPGTTNPLRSPDDPPRYNAVAVKIMEANGIRVNDLYALCKPQLDKLQLPKNVHFKPAGSQTLAKQVASVIEEELAAMGR